MKESTKRRVTRFLGDRLNIAVGVIATGLSIAILFIQPSSVWASLALVLFVVGLALLLIALHLSASAPALSYFEEVSFGEPAGYPLALMDNLAIRAVHGLINYEKARPEFVHAAPKNKEVQVVCQALQETGFSTVYGGPGEGKSMTAYHAAYQLKREAGYSPYVLRVDLLRDKSGEAFCDDLLEQLDRLKGKRKLIIVDDAQKLAERIELNRLMRQEASDGTLKVIWVETDFYEETASQRHPPHVRIDFRDFRDELVANLYRSQNVDLQYALRGKVEGLDEAIKKVAAGEIRDVWHFAFVASHGEKRIEEEISKLDYAETLVLFVISAYTVVSGEAELSTANLMNMLGTLEFGWLTDALRHRTLSDLIRSLQEYRLESPADKQRVQRMSLIRLYDRTMNDRGYVASLHYNSARAIVTAALLRTAIAENLIDSLRVLLTADYRRCAYMRTLLVALRPQRAPMFVKGNEEWFVGFLSNPLPDTIEGSQGVLNLMKRWDVQSYRTMLDKLDLEGIARGVAAIGVGGFGGLANLLHALGDKRMAVLDKVAWADFAGRVAKAEVTQFEQVATLLHALGDRRNALLDKVTWEDFAGRVASADVAQFDQVAFLLNALGDKRKVLLDKVAWEHFAGRLAKAEVTQFEQVANLLHALGDKRNALLDKVTWEDFAGRVASAAVTQFDQVAFLLNALGDKRKALVDKVAWEDFAGRVAKAKVTQFEQVANLLHALGDKRDALLDKVMWEDFAGRVAGADVAQFKKVADLLYALGDKRKVLLDKVAWEDFAGRLAKAEVTQFEQVANLLHALGDKRKALVDKVAWEDFAARVAKAEVTQFEQVAKLLRALGEKRDALMEKVDITSLSTTANRWGGDNPAGLTLLVASLNDKQRSNMVRDVDWALWYTRYPVKAGTLLTLGACLENVWRKAEMCANPKGCQEASVYLGAQMESLLRAVQDSYVNLGKNPHSYSSVAKFLFNCHRIDDRLAFEVAERTMGAALQHFFIRPGNYLYVGQLINAFHDVSPDLAKAFVDNPKIRSKITGSLNMHDWSNECLGARHLIKAIYRACPNTWLKMLKFVTVDLKGIDLESLYAEGSEAAAGSEPSGPE